MGISQIIACFVQCWISWHLDVSTLDVLDLELLLGLHILRDIFV
jgi:hypothetical protein